MELMVGAPDRIREDLTMSGGEADADVPKKQRFNGNHCGKNNTAGMRKGSSRCLKMCRQSKVPSLTYRTPVVIFLFQDQPHDGVVELG